MPDLLITAGPNGAGKSTIFPALQRVEREEWSWEPVKIEDRYFINADNIARELDTDEFDAGRLTIEKIGRCMEAGVDFAIESTFSGRTLAGHIRKARERGYRVYIAFMLLSSAELSMNRVTQRALLGKHYIPLERVMNRYRKSLNNFFSYYRGLADFWVVADNSRLEPAPVCWGGKLFASDTVFSESHKSIESLNQILERNGCDCRIPRSVVSLEDSFSPVIFNKIKSAIQIEIGDRPEGNFVVIEEEGQIRFVKVASRHV